MLKIVLRSVLVIIVLGSACSAECPIPLSCLMKSTAFVHLYSKIVSGDISISNEELGQICDERVAVQACIDTELGSCEPHEKPNLLLLTNYLDFICTTGLTEYGNVTDCLMKGITMFKMPRVCQEQLSSTNVSLLDFLVQLALAFPQFDDNVCRAMKIFRDCAAQDLARLCGDERAGTYWTQLNTQCLRAMSGSEDPDCSAFRSTTMAPTSPPTSTIRTVNKSNCVTPHPFLGWLVFVFPVVKWCVRSIDRINII